MQNMFCGNGNKLLVAVIAIGLILFTTIPLHAAQVTLAWDANDPTPDGYKVFRALEGVAYDYSTPVWTGTTTTCTISDLADYTTYRFVVRAFSGSDESSSSNEVTYYYEPTAPTYTITGTADANGTISPLGPVTVPESDSQTFTITPVEGYHVADVNVDGVSIGAATTYTFNNVTENHTISASFSLETYTITASAGQNGTISPSGQATIISGGSQTYAISPSEGYYIADVTVNGQSVGAVSTYTFSNVTSDNTITASFAVQSYTITAGAGTGGTISPSGTLSVNHGGSQTFAISPNNGYSIANVAVNGQTIGPVSTYTFSNITGNNTINATFAIQSHTVTASAGTGGSISPSGSTTVDHGGSLTFTITPDEGYTIGNVLVNGASVGKVSTYSFSNVSQDNTITASFQEEQDDSGAIIIDDGDTGTIATGTWLASSVAGYYGQQSLYTWDVGADYTFQTSISGRYDVSLWWTEHSTRGAAVPVEIWDGDTLLDVVEVNQQLDGGQWNVLGTYTFAELAKVLVVSEGDCPTNADAVKFQPSTIDSMIIDDGDPGTMATGTWKKSSGSGYYGEQSLYTREAGAEYTFQAALAGAYEVAMWWTEHQTRGTAVPVEIWDGSTLLDIIYVNQQQNGAQWNALGTYTFTVEAKVVVISEGGYPANADAVRFQAETVSSMVIDDGQDGTSSTGNWKKSSGAGYYGEQSLYTWDGGATYTFQAAFTGYTQVSLWWTEHNSRGAAVPVEIWDGDTLLDTVSVNQQQDGGQWNILGTYDFTVQAKVVIVSEGDGSTSADAAIFEKQ